MNIPNDYRFSESDLTHAFGILLRYEDSTDEELHLMEMAFTAEEMRHKTGVWPKYGEVVTYWWQERDAYWQRNFGKNAPR
jgi:hypothetical protein